MILPATIPFPLSRTKYFPTNDRATVRVGRLKNARGMGFGMTMANF